MGKTLLTANTSAHAPVFIVSPLIFSFEMKTGTDINSN